MTKKILVSAACLAVIGTACVILSHVRFSWNDREKLPAPRPDAVATSTAPNGNILVKNKTAGYAVTVPQDWYFEESAGSGVTVYPDYDAAGKAPPACKIEISAMPNPARLGLADWLAAYLRKDPTADVSEISRTAIAIGGAPGIMWSGALNGISSTLAYAATGTDVYEIAPSAIAPSGNIAPFPADCSGALQTIIENFEFLT
jgi:hypothetical protein